MRIDTAGIEGYDSMTTEQKLEAVLAQDLQPDLSGYVKKDVFDRTASALASTKRDLESRMSEAEREANARAEELQKLRDQNADLLMEKNISTYKARYIGMGYDNDLAESTATALAKGDIETVFANGQKFQEAHDKSVKASMLGSTKLPPAGESDTPLSVEDIMKIKDTAARQRAIAENAELFGLG